MTSKYFSFLLLLAYTHSSPLKKTTEFRNTRVDDALYRLPEGQISVLHYNIFLNLGKDLFESNNFEGSVEIQFQNLKSTNEIKIHANSMTFMDITLVDENNDKVVLADDDFIIDEVSEFLTLTTTTNLEADAIYNLTINYVTQLRTQLNGFYQSTYQSSDGSTVYLGTTQFESTSARKAFPCFDEPYYKATIDLTIRYPINYATGGEYNAIANTIGATKIDPDDSDFKITTFATTPRMSTYLLAFVVSDFTCSTSDEEVGVDIPHIICSRNDTESLRDLALAAGPKIARAMGDFTGVKYDVATIGKIHEAAIPDFSAGAMENWGLVTFREELLLWDPEKSTNKAKQSIITVIAHELGHFWFGDLVTCHWWSDIFLNEGFATYFETFAAHEVYPEMELDKQFVLNILQPVLVYDAYMNSAALSSPAASPTEISQRFSTISYNKGGSVIRMVSHFLGLENFKKGLNLYLDVYQFQPVTPEDLWRSLDAHKPENLPATVPEVMATWTEKPGFPLITVDVEDRNIKLTQRRFLSDSDATDTTTWWVPISYTTASDVDKFQDTTARFWLEPSDDPQIVPNALQNDNDWIILNNQQSGYYRIEYSDDLWDRILSALNQPDLTQIDPLNRAQIIDDFYNFVKLGSRSYVEFLQLCEFLKYDSSYYAWYPAINVFNSILTRLGDGQIGSDFREYLRESISLVYSSLSDITDDHQIGTLTKVLVLPLSCQVGVQSCIDEAINAFAQHRDQNIIPNKNLKTYIYCNGLRYSPNIQKDFDFIWKQYLNDDLAAEKSTFLSALGCTTDKETLKEYLLKAITAESGLVPQDSESVFRAVYSQNVEGVDVTLDFVVENFSLIVQYLDSVSDYAVSSVLNGLAAKLTRQDQLDKLSDFLENGDLEGYEQIVRIAFERAHGAVTSTQQFEEEISPYFKPATDPPVTDPPVTDPPVTDPPVTDPPVTDPPVTDPPVTGSTPSDDDNTADALSAKLTTLLISFFVFVYLR